MAPKNVPWKAVVEGTRSGPAKFVRDVDIDSTTLKAWEMGIPVTNGKGWKVFNTRLTVGAKSGQQTPYMICVLSDHQMANYMDIQYRPRVQEIDKMTMLDETEINLCFERCGWSSIKQLTEFDGEYLSEDLAQYEKNGIIIDFGFYGDGVEPVNGEFRIYVIENGDWGNVKGKFQTPYRVLALRVLQSLASIELNGELTG